MSQNIELSFAMQHYGKKWIFKIAGILLFLLVLQGCATEDSCFIFEQCITRVAPLSLEDAKNLEYPLYLPASQTLELFELQEIPTPCCGKVFYE